jgi:hypothetical protein
LNLTGSPHLSHPAARQQRTRLPKVKTRRRISLLQDWRGRNNSLPAIVAPVKLAKTTISSSSIAHGRDHYVFSHDLSKKGCGFFKDML